MEFDVFEQLAEKEVPPPPVTLRHDIHERLNRLLVVIHLGELFFKGGVYAVGHLLRGFLALVAYSFAGQFPAEKPQSDNDTRSGN